MQHLLDVTAANGVPFRVAVNTDTPKWQAQFYDRRFPGNSGGLTKHGQAVARYYVHTLIDDKWPGGLILYGGEPDWRIDAHTMAVIHRWLCHLDESVPAGPQHNIHHLPTGGNQ